MAKFILKETEAFAPAYRYEETFDNLEDAQNRMRELYHECVIDGNVDAVEKGELNEMSAYCLLTDENEICWDIEEVTKLPKQKKLTKAEVLSNKEWYLNQILYQGKSTWYINATNTNTKEMVDFEVGTTYMNKMLRKRH